MTKDQNQLSTTLLASALSVLLLLQVDLDPAVPDICSIEGPENNFEDLPEDLLPQYKDNWGDVLLSRLPDEDLVWDDPIIELPGGICESDIDHKNPD